jgi:hypothetical protein
MRLAWMASPASGLGALRPTVVSRTSSRRWASVGGARAPRTVTKLWERSEALVALSRHATARLRRLTPPPGRGIVALDGLQPAVGQEVLWGLRAGLAGAVRLARRLRSATHPD